MVTSTWQEKTENLPRVRELAARYGLRFKGEPIVIGTRAVVTLEGAVEDFGKFNAEFFAAPTAGAGSTGG